MTLPKPRPLPVAIPTVLLADLVLLVVLFFVFTTTDDVDGSRVLLPEAPASAVAELGSARAVLERRAEPGGRVRWIWSFSDGEHRRTEVDAVEGLFAPVAAVAAKDPGRTFVIKADAEAHWSDVDRTVEVLRGAGARNLVFWTREPQAGEIR
ncbi:MAG TPA: biopolymer transporter ExbD [Candidatus Polarisedimenticolaceae bacterium]